MQQLIEACITDEDKLYLCVSSPTIKDKPVQIRPWRLSDADFVLDASMPLDPRKTVFVGGVPRPLKAGKLLHSVSFIGSINQTRLKIIPQRTSPKTLHHILLLYFNFNFEAVEFYIKFI